MPATRTPRRGAARGMSQTSEDNAALDPSLRSMGAEQPRSRSPSGNPYTLSALIEADAHNEELGGPSGEEDPLSSLARQAIAADENDDNAMFEPEEEVHMDETSALTNALEAYDREEVLQKAESGSQHDGAGSSMSRPGRGPAGQGARKGKKSTTPNGGLVAEESRDLARMKKDSHKEVERKRRDNINEGINALAALVPDASEKLGKGQILKLAALYLQELSGKKPGEPYGNDAEKLQNELSMAQAQLTEEHARSIQYETSWREAEDRAATAQFELERVKKELEDVKMQLLEKRR